MWENVWLEEAKENQRTEDRGQRTEEQETKNKLTWSLTSDHGPLLKIMA